MTHEELVIRAVRWLRNTYGCRVIAAERVSFAGEIPDAIGWKSHQSVLIEAKTSRGDFKRDLKKRFRRRPEEGMGDYRYFITPPGLLRYGELPEQWGLLEVHQKMVRVKKQAQYIGANLRKERTLLVSSLRRKELGVGEKEVELFDA